LKNAAKNIITDIFKNSVGWIVNGIHGIDNHHLAHHKLVQTVRTTTSKNNAIQNICFEYFSIKL
jgi:hypothetical protein